MPIEFLSQENIEEMLTLSEVSQKDSAWKDYVFDREVLKKNLQKMIGDDHYFTCIYRKNEKIIGFFFATLGTFLFSNVLLGMENGIYIDREHRGGRVAFSMYRKFIDWCASHNAEPLIEIYFGSNDDNEKTYGFFRKIGMIECGRVFRGGIDGVRKKS